MDVVLYMQHKIKQISEEHAMNMDKNMQWIWRETSSEKDYNNAEIYGS